MDQLHDLDPKLQRFADIAVAEIAVPPIHRRAPAAARTRPSRGMLVVVTALGLVLFASGAALATGLFSEVFRIGNVSRSSRFPDHRSFKVAGASSRWNSR